MFNSQWTLSNSSLLLLSIVLSLSYALLLLLLILSLLVGIFCHFTNSCYVFENYLQLSYSIVSPSSLTSSPTLLSFSSWILFVIFCSIWKLLYQVYKILLCYQKDILIFLANSISSSIGNFKAILLTQCIGSFNYLQNYTTKCNFNTKVTCIIAASTRRIHYKSLCHGMNRLFSLYLGILIFTELYGFTYVEGKPITGANERRFGHLDLHPSSSKSVHSSPQRTPKVVMPPYDLGFKGQKTDEVNKLRSSSLSSSSSSSSSFYKDNYGNFDQMNGFQSDETYDQGSQQRQHYQRVNRDEFEPQKNYNGDVDDIADLSDSQMIYGPTLSQSSNVNRNMGPFSGKQPLPSSIQSLSDKELNERLGYRRVNLGPSKAPIQQQQQQIPHSPYSPYSKRNNYHGSIYMPDQETMYDMNAQQYPHQENTWSRNNHHQNNLNQRHDLYDSYTAYMNRDNPSSWFPVPSFQNNIPLENKPTYSHQQQQQQHQKPSSMNSYSQFNIPNSNMDNSNNKRNQLPYFQDISDLQLSHLIHQYQMELLRRQSERLLDTDYQLGHNYYNQPAEPPLHYIPSYYPQDHGLHLYGSNNHDKIIQKFNNLANQRLVAGIDEFFDELDHNRDGVIMVDELRNYLLLHEIH